MMEDYEIYEVAKILSSVKNVVMLVLNEGFDIELTENECFDAANRIIGVLSKKH
jgi:hypothetical protein